MNWQAMNFDWNQVRAFLATVEEGSLSAAARALGLTQPTLGRQVTALEEELGVTLFERSGRSLILTASGEAVVNEVRAMAEAATRVSLVASGQVTSVEGVVKVSASEIYSAYILPDVIAGLRKTHPRLRIEVVATNALSDLRMREADIAVRNTEPTDPEMIARRLTDHDGALFASRGFLAEHGPIASVTDLADLPIVAFGSEASFLKALQERQVPVTEKNFVTGSENHLVHWALARRGIGLGVNSLETGRIDGDMVPVLTDVLSFRFPVWLVAPRELKTSRRVRVVFDALAEGIEKRRGPNSA